MPHTSPQAAARAGVKEAGREGGKSRREGPTGGTAGARSGGGSEGGRRRLGGNSAPPLPVRRSRQHGRGAVPGARAASPSPHGSFAPGDSEGWAASEPTARAPPWPAPSTTQLPRGESRSFSAPCGALLGGKPPTQCLRKNSIPRRFWMVHPALLAFTLHSFKACGWSPALQIIERLLCADLNRGWAERVGQAIR